MPLNPTQPTANPRSHTQADGDDPHRASLEEVYAGSTAVLIVGGEEQRDPANPQDRHCAVVEAGEPVYGSGSEVGPTGPAWKAEDLYTSTRFASEMELAKRLTGSDGSPVSKWAILTAEHHVVEPWSTVTSEERSISDLGGDEMNPEHRVTPSWQKRRPDGREIVTERDMWAQRVAVSLMKWLASFRSSGAPVGSIDYELDTLLVVGDEEWIAPLRERGVFEYGISRMVGNPNQGLGFPLTPRYLYPDQGLADANPSTRVAWLSDALSQLPERREPGEQVEVNKWTGEEERSCDRCGVTASETKEEGLVAVGGGTYCADCHPDECGRCGEWTHETGLGAYPLCVDCQTDRGGQIREPIDADPTEPTTLSDH